MLSTKKRKTHNAAARVNELAKMYPEYRIGACAAKGADFKWRVYVTCGVAPVARLTPAQVQEWVDNFTANKLAHDHKVRMLRLSAVPHAG